MASKKSVRGNNTPLEEKRMSRRIQHYSCRSFADARRRIMRRNIRDAYARGFRDAVTIKDLFNNLFNETRKALPRAEDAVKRDTLKKIKAFAVKALKAVKSGLFEIAIALVKKIGAIAKNIREFAISFIANMISSVCYKHYKRGAKYALTGNFDKGNKGGDYDNGKSIDIDYTILS